MKILFAFSLMISFQLLSGETLICGGPEMKVQTTDMGKTKCTDISKSDAMMIESTCCWMKYKDGSTQKYTCEQMIIEEKAFNLVVKGYKMLYTDVEISCSSSSLVFSLILIFSLFLL